MRTYSFILKSIFIILGLLVFTTLISCTNGGNEAMQPASLDSVVTDLHSTDKDVVLKATRDSAQFLQDPQITAALVANLGHPDIDVAQETCTRLMEAGDSAMPAVIDALADPTLRSNAFFVLTRDSVPHPEAVPRILELLPGASIDMEVNALRYFDRWGDGGADITDFITQVLGDTGSDPEAIRLALSTVRTQRYSRPRLISAIVSNMGPYTNIGRNIDAAETLAYIAPLDVEAADLVKSRLLLPGLSQDESIWLNTALYIGDPSNSSGLDVILDGLQSDSTEMLDASVNAINILPNPPDSVHDALEAALGNPNLPQALADRIRMMLTNPSLNNAGQPGTIQPGN
jgi:hypothetical protein